MKVFDEKGNVLEDKDLEKIRATPGGQEKIQKYMDAARVGYAATEMVKFMYSRRMLSRPPLSQEEAIMARIVWYCLKEATQEEVDRHIDYVTSNEVQEEFFPDEPIGNA